MDEICLYFLTYFVLFYLYLYNEKLNFLINLIATISFLLRISAILARYFKQYLPNKSFVNPKNKIVLITGCDSGFGLRAAKRLDYYGYYVLAGVLSKQSEGAKELEKYSSKKLKIIKLDVTNHEDIESALDLISYLTNYKPVLDKLEEKEASKSVFDKKFKNPIFGTEDGDLQLWALVNNAGLGFYAPIEFGSFDDYKKIIDVNLMGLIKTTLTFLPLIRQSKGRLVHMGSIYSDLASVGSTHYAISKSGLRAFNTCLRQELSPFGVKSILIKPAFYCTPLCETQNMEDRFINVVKNTDPIVLKDYKFDIYSERFMSLMSKFFNNISSNNLDEVIDQIEDAVSNSSPKDDYPIGNYLQTFVVWFLGQLNTKFYDILTFKIWKKLF